MLNEIQKKEQELTALNEHAKQLETQVIELEEDVKAAVDAAIASGPSGSSRSRSTNVATP